MRKLHYLLIFAMLLSLSAYTQKGKEIVLGLGGGFTNVWIIEQNFYGEPEVDYAPKTGHAFNANLGYSFTEQISVITEFQFSAQGQKYEGKQSFTYQFADKPNESRSFIKIERNIKLRYFNIPLFFKYTFGAGGTRFRVMGGPQLSLLTNATQEYLRDGELLGSIRTNTEGKSFVTDQEDIKERFEKSNWGAAIDVGADIYLTKNIFVNAGMRINYMFSDINAEPYRLPAPLEPYEESRNLWGGAYVGINYLLDVEGYKQRSF